MIKKDLLLATLLIIMTVKRHNHLIRHAIIDIRSKQRVQDTNPAESDSRIENNLIRIIIMFIILLLANTSC
jgi:hypothetical protein